MFGITTAQPAHQEQQLAPAGPSALGTYARAQQAHNVVITNGNLTQVAGDSTVNQNHYYHPPAPKVDLTSLLRLVRNLRQIQQDNLSKATPGTGIWFLRSPYFLLWLDLEGSLKILWGTGIPGAGKTVLSAIIINELEARARVDKRICVAYIYFRYTDGADLAVRDVLEILVKQTIERHQDCKAIAEDVYLQHESEGTRPSETELLHLLSCFVRLKSATFYFLDALDEAPSKIQVDIVKKLASLNIRLFIVSRSMPAVQALIPNAHQFSISAQDSDLNLHIAQVIGRSQSLHALFARADSSLKGEITSSIKKKCGGMFLHASLQLNALSECATLYEAKDILTAFPSDIEDVYLTTWGRISKQQHAQIAMSVFLWVLYATKPITIDVIEQAVATCPTTFAYDTRRLMPKEMLMTICCGLVTIEDKSQLVRLVHYTAKGPIENLLHKLFPHPHSHIAAVCMAHLVQREIHNGLVASQNALDLILGDDPLLAYAFDAWDAHARSSLRIPGSRSRIASFISSCSAFPYSPYPWGFDTLYPLHMLAFFCLPLDLIPASQSWDPNIRTGVNKQTPLMATILSNKRGEAHGLLNSDSTRVDDPSGVGVSAHTDPTQEATGRDDDEEFVKLLLEHPEIQVNLVDEGGRSALILAACNGHQDIVKLLLARPEILVNLVDEHGRSALIFATQYGHHDIARLLLARPEIQVNLVAKSGRSALIWAAQHGHQDIVKLLLARPEIQVNLVDKKGWSALMSAVHDCHQDIVKLLLARPDIQVNLVDEDGWSALIFATQYSRQDIVKLLLACSEIQVNLVDKHGLSALIWAAQHGHQDIVKLLLARLGIQVNLVDHYGRSALIWAAYNGHQDIVKLLLARPEIQVNLVDKDEWSALIWAAYNGHQDIVKLLLARPDIQVNLVDEDGRSALILAASEGHQDIVKLLLARPDIQVNLVDKKGWSALMSAVHDGHQDIVKLLLARPKIQVNLVDEDGQSALISAAQYGHHDIVKLLLARPEIQVNLVNNKGQSALVQAAHKEHAAVVSALLAFPGIRDDCTHQHSPLNLASDPPPPRTEFTPKLTVPVTTKTSTDWLTVPPKRRSDADWEVSASKRLQMSDDSLEEDG